MFLDPRIKRLFLFVSLLIIIAAAGVEGFGQCGVYLKHTSTQQIPFAHMYLDNFGDMTGDGVADLIAWEDVSGDDSTGERILVIPNNGNGTFGTATGIDAPAGGAFDPKYSFGRINGDALNDLVLFDAYSTDPQTMRIYFNNGNGTFTAHTPVSVSSRGRLWELVDINGDGNTDYLGWVWSSGFKYSLGNGNGGFLPAAALFPVGVGYSGDYNGDGKLDLINQQTLHINQGNMQFTAFNISSVLDVGDVIAGRQDFNGDGKMDVMVSSTSGAPMFAILTATGTGFTRTNYDVTIAGNPDGLSMAGNFSGSDAPDVVYTYRYQNKKVVFTNDGAGNFTRQDLDGRFFRFNFLRSAYADFDGDGKMDAIHANSGITNSRLVLRDVSSVTFLKNVCDRPGQPRIVDFDGTGNTDWSYWDPATGNWALRSNAYQGSYGPYEQDTVNWGLGSLGDIPTPGDFDGDGVVDRAVYRDSTGIWYIRRSSDLAWFVLLFGLPGDRPVAADYDGDTITDIAVWRPSDGVWYFWYMGTQQFSAMHFGSNGDKPVPADFDGDLKTDIGVYRPSTGVWYYQNSSDGSYAATQWGINTDRPIPGDFDGDGKADLTVYRESDLLAYILRSSTGTASYYRFGLPGDILQIGDYDGDFIADIGVFRPSDNSWWISSYPITAQIFGVENAVPTSSIFNGE